MKFLRSPRPSLSVICGTLLAVGCSLNLAEKHWELGEQYQRQGNFLRAIEEYSKVVNFGQRDPVAIRAQLQIAEIYERSVKDYPRAIRAYRDAYRRTEDPAIRIEARSDIAKIYAESMNDPLNAAEEYHQLFAEGAGEQKEGPDLMLSWAKALSEAGRFSEAADKYDEFRRKYPGHKEGPRTLFEEGQAWLADRRPEKALVRFRETIEKFSGQPAYESLVSEAYYGLGNALEMNDQLDSALEAYKQSLGMYPNKKVIELKIDRVMRRKKEKRL